MEKRELATKLVDIYRDLDRFDKSLLAIGLETDSSHLSEGMDSLSELILTVLGVPEDDTLKYDYGTPEYSSAYCRDYWTDGFFGFFDEEAPSDELVNWILEELEDENGEQSNN